MAGDDSPELDQRRHVNRERVTRTLTFWLRPEFVLRVVNRFQIQHFESGRWVPVGKTISGE